MLAPVLLKNNRPVVLPYKNQVADNFLDAYAIGVGLEISTGWQFTNSFIDINIAKGIHAKENGMDIIVLRNKYARAQG